MTEPWVFDHTALIALFEGNAEIFGLWRHANRGTAGVIFPAAAIAEANHAIGADDDAWSAVLFPADVRVAPLDQSTAIATGREPGALATRQVAYEADAVLGVIVTRAPWQYPPDVGPIRAI